MEQEQIIDMIKEAIEQLRPSIQLDGGDIEYVRFEDGIVYVRFHGACVGCPASMITLKMGIEESLKEQFPEHITEVIALDEYEV